MPDEMIVNVPTYNGETGHGDPELPVKIASAPGGVEVTLGPESLSDAVNQPSLFIERRPTGWWIGIAAHNGGDMNVMVTVRDDGDVAAQPNFGGSCQFLDLQDPSPLQ